MKTFILHLERAPDRKEHMLNETKKHNLDYEFFKAFDCLNLTDQDFSKFCDMEMMKKHPNWLNPGMVCACYSHYLIYQKMLEEDLDYCLITEDDVTFSDEILHILKAVEDNIKKNEVILLHYMSFSPLELRENSSIRISKNFTIYEGVNSFPNVNSAAGYIITRDAAKSLSKIVLPVKYGTDAWSDFGKDGGIESLRFIYPCPVKVAGFKSKATTGKSKLWNDITGLVDYYKIPLFFRLFRYLRLRSVENRSKVIIR